MKVLIISHNSFSDVLNNGKTLESFFNEIDKENLAQLFFCSNESPDFKYCNNYFKITDYDVLRGCFSFSSTCGQIINNNSGKQFRQYNGSGVGLRLFKFLRSKASYLSFFRDILWKCKTWNTVQLKGWCKEQCPDLLFYVGGNLGFSHQIAYSLSQYLDVPLVSYFTDDYLIYPIKRNLFDIIQKQRMKSFYKNTINHSSLCFGIGDLMCQEYSKYFNKDFFPLMNSIEKQDYKPYVKKERVTISYFGGLHLNRWKMLLRLAHLVDNIAINVYSVTSPASKILEQFEAVGISFKGKVSGEDLKKEILDSDILLHVESDDAYYQSLTRLSVSTKIPEYLMSGRIIVGFGPEHVASMKILSDNKIGIVIPASSTDDKIKQVMNGIISDYDLRKEIGLRGYNYAIQNFDNEKITHDFVQKLESIINI